MDSLAGSIYHDGRKRHDQRHKVIGPENVEGHSVERQVWLTAADQREVVTVLWITVGLLAVLGWPAAIMLVALLQERLGRRRAER